MDYNWLGEHEYTMPNRVTYPWMWLWNSCFHAIIYAALGDERAMLEANSIFRWQTEDGMVPHMGYQAEQNIGRLAWRSHGRWCSPNHRCTDTCSEYFTSTEWTWSRWLNVRQREFASFSEPDDSIPACSASCTRGRREPTIHPVGTDGALMLPEVVSGMQRGTASSPRSTLISGERQSQTPSSRLLRPPSMRCRFQRLRNRPGVGEREPSRGSDRTCGTARCSLRRRARNLGPTSPPTARLLFHRSNARRAATSLVSPRAQRRPRDLA